MIEIDEKRLAELLKAKYILGSLYSGGVDNWMNFDEAMNDCAGGYKSAREVEDMSTEEIIAYLF